jgi:DNA polymerase
MLTYEGYEQGKWGRLKTYGGKLVENIIQATARDCLAEAMLRLDAAGYKIVMHVHDEVVLEVPAGKGSLEEIEELMSRPISWAPGLPMKTDGFETDYYMKD